MAIASVCIIKVTFRDYMYCTDGHFDVVIFHLYADAIRGRVTGINICKFIFTKSGGVALVTSMVPFSPVNEASLWYI